MPRVYSDKDGRKGRTSFESLKNVLLTLFVTISAD